MVKRLGVLGAAIALVALAVGVVGPAFGSSGDDDDDKQWTIRVTSITTEEGFVDLGDEGDSLGDQFVFSSKYLKLERQEAQCVATAWFHNGQITAQALINFSQDPPAIPITGGSGKYEGAEGELHVRPISQTKEVLTFHLED